MKQILGAGLWEGRSSSLYWEQTCWRDDVADTGSRRRPVGGTMIQKRSRSNGLGSRWARVVEYLNQSRPTTAFPIHAVLATGRNVLKLFVG